MSRRSVPLLLCLHSRASEACQFAQESLWPGYCAAGAVMSVQCSHCVNQPGSMQVVALLAAAVIKVCSGCATYVNGVQAHATIATVRS